MSPSQDEALAPISKPRYWPWVQLALTLASLVGLGVFCAKNADIFATIVDLDLGSLTVVFAAYLLLSLLRALALKVTHYRVLPRVSLKPWWAIATVTGTLNLLLIGAAGGAWRALTLKAHRSLKIIDSLTIQFWIFFSMILVASMAMGIGVYVAKVESALGNSLLGLSIAGGVVSLAILRVASLRSASETPSDTSQSRWKRILAHTSTIGMTPTAILRLLLISLLNLLLGSIAIHAGFAAFGVSISPATALIFGSLFLLSTLIQLTPGNIGIVEGSIGVMAALLGNDAEYAVAVMLVLRVVNLAAVALPMPYALTILKRWDANEPR